MSHCIQETTLYSFKIVLNRTVTRIVQAVQQYLKDTLKSRFVKNTEWPPPSPDCNHLDYFFWNNVQEKVYQGRHCEPFENTEELKTKIMEVWGECSSDLKSIRKATKQFLPRLEAVELKDGDSIKTLFG